MKIDVKGKLQSWLDDDNIIVNAIFLESFRCVTAGPGESGKTFLAMNLFLSSIQFDRLYIIGPTGDQYENLQSKDIVFIKEIKDLPSPDQPPKDIKKLILFDDVGSKEPVINEYFCRGSHCNCDMICLKQNRFSADRQNVYERIVIYFFLCTKR